jgi:hypothetical protein
LKPILRTVQAVTFAWAALSGTGARADCVDGMRELSAAERAYFHRTQAALAAALPPAPPNFRRTDTAYDFRAAPSLPVMCKEQKNGSFDVNLVARYLYTHPRTPGDPEGGTVRDFDVRVAVNLRQPPQPGSTPKGDYGAWGTPTTVRSADLKVHNVAFGVNGPEGPARKALLDLVDTAWLQALVGRALPEVAASEAQAAKQVERAKVAVAAPAPAPSAPPAAAPMPPAASPAPPAAPAVPAAPPAAGPASPAAPPTAGGTPAPVAASPAPAPAAPAPAPAPAPAAGCPPRADGGQAASAGAAIGGAVLGGGFGRNLGSMIGGAVGAVAGSAPPGCPN